MRRLLAVAGSVIGGTIAIGAILFLALAAFVPTPSPEEIARRLECEQFNAKPAPMTREQAEKWIEEAGPVTCM